MNSKEAKKQRSKGAKNQFELERIRVIEAKGVTHLSFRVVKSLSRYG